MISEKDFSLFVNLNLPPACSGLTFQLRFYELTLLLTMPGLVMTNSKAKRQMKVSKVVRIRSTTFLFICLLPVHSYPRNLFPAATGSLEISVINLSERVDLFNGLILCLVSHCQCEGQHKLQRDFLPISYQSKI